MSVQSLNRHPPSVTSPPCPSPLTLPPFSRLLNFTGRSPNPRPPTSATTPRTTSSSPVRLPLPYSLLLPSSRELTPFASPLTSDVPGFDLANLNGDGPSIPTLPGLDDFPSHMSTASSPRTNGTGPSLPSSRSTSFSLPPSDPSDPNSRPNIVRSIAGSSNGGEVDEDFEELTPEQEEKHKAFVKARGRHYSNEGEAMKVSSFRVSPTRLQLSDLSLNFSFVSPFAFPSAPKPSSPPRTTRTRTRHPSSRTAATAWRVSRTSPRSRKQSEARLGSRMASTGTRARGGRGG